MCFLSYNNFCPLDTDHDPEKMVFETLPSKNLRVNGRMGKMSVENLKISGIFLSYSDGMWRIFANFHNNKV